jgi:hypothetical protein
MNIASVSMHGWPEFPPRTCTTCGNRAATGSAFCTTAKLIPPLSTLGNDASRNRTEGPVTCAWTAHQGDQDGVKGVYHINAMDELTPWQTMVSGLPVGVGFANMGGVAQSSEAWLFSSGFAHLLPMQSGH